MLLGCNVWSWWWWWRWRGWYDSSCLSQRLNEDVEHDFDGNKVDKAQRPRMMAGSGIPSSSGWVETTMIDSQSWFYGYRLAECFEWRWSHQFVYYITVYNHISVQKRCGDDMLYICLMRIQLYKFYKKKSQNLFQINLKLITATIFFVMGTVNQLCTFQHPQATPYSRYIPAWWKGLMKDSASSMLHCRVRGKGIRIGKINQLCFVYLL